MPHRTKAVVTTSVKEHTARIRNICDALDADIGEEHTLFERVGELSDEVHQLMLIGDAWGKTVRVLQQIETDVQRTVKPIRSP